MKARFGNFGVTAKGVYFLSEENTIQFLDTASGRVSTLATLDKAYELGGLSVTPDGASIAWFQCQEVGNLMLVEGFR